jgi:hypothetical protein
VQVPYSEGLAHHTGPESCVDDPRGRGEALAGVRVGWPLSRENGLSRDADAVHGAEGHTEGALCECPTGPAWSKNPACAYAPCSGTERSLAWPPALPVVRIGKARSRSR